MSPTKLTLDDLNDICRAAVETVLGNAPANFTDEELDTFNAGGERMFFAATEYVNENMTREQAVWSAEGAAREQHRADVASAP